jgi:hypothetical protein
LFSAGTQVPVYPLLEVVGNAVKLLPEQIGATAAKVGAIVGLTVMVKVGCVAQTPATGAKV